MDARQWTVLIIEPNRFEANIIGDVLRGAGAGQVRIAPDAAQASLALEAYPANIVIASFDMAPTDGAAWTREFRRNRRVLNRRAAVFLTSHAFSRLVAEQCRHAGANALIGKPLSSKTLLATIGKVLEKPRPFIDNPDNGYVGPCRRAGIVTAGPPRLRRRTDAEIAEAAAGAKLRELIAGAGEAASALATDPALTAPCLAALAPLRAEAERVGDGPLMRACAALALHLSTAGLAPEAFKAGAKACGDGFRELAGLDQASTPRREGIAEAMRLAVARAALQSAA